MTSVQFMLRRLLFGCFVLSACVAMSGCATSRLDDPLVLRTPYPETRIWAATPFLNESGVSVADGTRFADLFLAQVEQVDGLEAIPLNRTLVAMQSLGIDAVRTEAEARTLLSILGVDAIVVGTISAYDPYPPLKLGAAVALFTTDRVQHAPSPRELTLSHRGEPAIDQLANRVTTASGVFDNTNHRTLGWLRDYARGRHVPESAFGPSIFESSMNAYIEFVSYALIHDLLVRETARLAADSTMAVR